MGRDFFCRCILRFFGRKRGELSLEPKQLSDEKLAALEKQLNGWLLCQHVNVNNLSNFVAVQYSRNHFSSVLRDFYQWVANTSNGCHGVLYELDHERSRHEDTPYRTWRLSGGDFEECDEAKWNKKCSALNP